MDRQHQLPKLTLDSLYSWSNLQQALNNGPMSAPPINNYGGSRGAPSTPNRDDGAGLLGRDRDRDQFFFGHDFTSVFPPLDSSGCGGSGSNKNANNNTNSSEPDLQQQQQQDFADHFHSLLNLRRSPNPMMMMEPPMSAPPINIRGGGGLLAAGSSSGTHQYKSNNRFVHRSQMKINQPETYSLKVFLGGIPPNLSTNILQLNFAKYGPNFIDWPKKTPTQDRPPNGYAFVVYESDLSIGRMLRECTQSSGGRLIFPVFNLNGVMNQIEVKVWEMKNTTFINQVGWRKFRSYSVFVGGIPRTCTAALLTCAVEETIGPVAYCSIELDQRHFYPKGAACVVFTAKEHYIKAIAAHEVVLSFGTFERKVEFKAFLAANMPCEKCGQTTGTRYCNEMICLAYFCSNCWKLVHNVRPSMSSHQPSRRQSSSGGSK